MFIHVPKTGGTSLRQFLQPFSEDELLVFRDPKDGKTRYRNGSYHFIKHSPLSEFKEMIEPKLYKSLFKIATIRNPWDRMISFYFSPHRKYTEWNRSEFIRIVEKAKPAQFYLNTPDWAARTNKRLGISLIPERPHFLTDEIDFLIRFERLQEDVQRLCELIDIPFASFPFVNQSFRKRYTHYYDDELKMLITQKFKKEITCGDYSF